MNGANDSFAALGQTFHALDERDGHVGVEAAGWLVTKENGRICDHFGCECEASSFAARYAFDAAIRISDTRILALFQVQLNNNNNNKKLIHYKEFY